MLLQRPVVQGPEHELILCTGAGRQRGEGQVRVIGGVGLHVVEPEEEPLLVVLLQELASAHVDREADLSCRHAHVKEEPMALPKDLLQGRPTPGET